MERKRKPLSYVFGEPQRKTVKLPPIKSPASKFKSPRGSFSQLQTSEDIPELLSTKSSYLSPKIKDSFNSDFLPYIYAQNGLEYTNRQLQNTGSYMDSHFILNKRMSSVNLLDVMNNDKIKYNPRAGTLEVIRDTTIIND